jgi:hypothetical protein
MASRTLAKTRITQGATNRATTPVAKLAAYSPSEAWLPLAHITELSGELPDIAAPPQRGNVTPRIAVDQTVTAATKLAIPSGKLRKR